MQKKIERELKKEIKKKNKSWGVIAILVVIATISIVYEYYEKNTPRPSDEVIALSKCVDGDTAELYIEGAKEKVRFLAIDTPETVKPNTEVQPYGKEASNYTCERLMNADEIQLEYEGGNKTDKYGRLLAWIWVDGDLLQEELIELGYAEVKYIYGNYKYTDRLYDLEDQAKIKEVGIWGLSD